MRRWAAEQGFSLVETLVATAVMLIVLYATYMIFDTSQQNYARGLARASVQQDVRVAIERMAKEFRLSGYNPSNSGCTSPPAGAITAVASSPGSVTFQADVDNNSCTDKVVYTFVPPSNLTKPCDNGDSTTIGKITRAVQSWNGTAWNPATPTALNVAQCITAFTPTYVDSGGIPTGSTTNVFRITVSGTTNARITATQSYTVITDVMLRNQ
jgi:prepilin-type N-terminal cleavage/methylation domain-containing protein